MIFDKKSMPIKSSSVIICQSLCDASTVFRLKLVKSVVVNVPHWEPVSRAARGLLGLLWFLMPLLSVTVTGNYNY